MIGADLGGLHETARAIASLQHPDGWIPWEAGRHVDPWNHVEALMGIDACGLHDNAVAGYRWLARIQENDGSWSSAYLNGEAMDPMVDSNFCAYFAAGMWHHFLATGDQDLLREMWPTMEAAIDMVVSLQRPDGSIAWARDERGTAWPGALLTSSSCIYLSLRCAVAVSEVLGKERREWPAALQLLGRAVASDPGAFDLRDRYAMDWYYPVLAGAVEGGEARRRLQGSWHRFVVPGWGALCVVDRPWVTAGETAELILACDRVGLKREALRLWAWLARLRDSDGLYWTGKNHPSGDRWPHEKTSWSAGSVLLAADALFGEGPTSTFFSRRPLL